MSDCKKKKVNGRKLKVKKSPSNRKKSRSPSSGKKSPSNRKKVTRELSMRFGNYNPLTEACITGDLEVVKNLVSQGADVEADGNIALGVASSNGNLAVVKYLVSQGADVNGNSPLRKASENGHLAVVKYLVTKGANIRFNSDAALRFASLNGHLAVVKYLASEGANVQAGNNWSIRWASKNGHLKVVKWFVDQCHINPHIDDDILVRTASDNNHFDIVKYLVIYHGAPTTHVRQDFIDRLPLTVAVKQWRNRMEVDEANLESPFGKYMARKNYAKYLEILKEEGYIIPEE